jgi:hypothetical protein
MRCPKRYVQEDVTSQPSQVGALSGGKPRRGLFGSPGPRVVPSFAVKRGGSQGYRIRVLTCSSDLR